MSDEVTQLERLGERIRQALRAEEHDAPLPNGWVGGLVADLPPRPAYRQRWWMALAPVAALGLGLIVLIGAYLLWGRGPTLPPATEQPSATPVAMPTAVPLASPTVDVTASPPTVATPTPSPSPSSSPITTDPWIELTRTQDSFGTTWSPDSQHILLRRPRVNGHPNRQFVDLFDRDGNLVRTYQAMDEGVWLDGERFVLTAWQRYQPRPGDPWVIDYHGGKAPGTSYLGSVASNELTELDVDLGGAISNGRGALAIYGCLDCSEDGWQPGYQIWTLEGDLSEPRPGYPETWSPDGKLLRLERPLGTGPARESWYEIVSWPAFETVYADRDRRSLALNPAWTHTLSFEDGLVHVVDLATGETSATIAAPVSGQEAVWDAEGRLVLADYEDEHVSVYGLDGTRVAYWEGVGNSLRSSADGSTWLVWRSDQPEREGWRITIVRNLESRSVTAPGGMSGYSAVQLSPDGERLLVFCWTRGLTAFVLEI